MKIGLAIPLAMLFCLATHVTSTADLPPIAHVAGFSRATDGQMNVVYQAFAQMLEPGTVDLRLECRPTGSVSPADWTTMGIGVPVGSDSLLWSVEWQPCLLIGDFELRMVASDSSGNAPDLQPTLYVGINNCVVTPIGKSVSTASAWFEDSRLDDMGLVYTQVATPELHHSMLAIYEAQSGAVATETIPLLVPDPENAAWYVGRFDPSPIQQGGVGRFWLSYTDASQRTTHLTFAQMTIGCATANLDSHVANNQICARVQIEAGALVEYNCVALFPSRIPTSNVDSPIRIWPNCATGDLATAIRLTGPQGFPAGTYAQVQISYRASVPDEYLSVERLTGPPLVGIPGLPYGSIGEGIADFRLPLSELEGVYAVISRAHSSEQQQPVLPESPFVAQNYPNPFNTSTVIPFDLETAAEWTLDIFNVTGQKVRTLSGQDVAGRLRATWDGRDGRGRQVVSGIYFYRFTSGDYSATRAMVLVK